MKATAGQQHYENVCMKAVNQSIGRAIRHAGDYACILLVDHRFSRASISNKLPGWIRQRLQNPASFSDTAQRIGTFYSQHGYEQGGGGVRL